MRGDGRRLALRVQLATENTVKWRHSPTLEHGDLCRALGLDPVRARFDLPRNVSAMGQCAGYVLFDGEQIGTLHVAFEDEKLKDRDPVAFLRERL